MTTVLNTANCGTTADTGVANCAVSPSLIKYFVATPKGYVIDASSLVDLPTFITSFKAAFIDDARNNRFFLSPLLTNIDLKGGDEVTETRDNYDFTVQFKPYNWSWLMNGSFCDFINWRKLAQFAQARYDFLFIDDAGTIWGTSALDAEGNNGIGGFAMAQIVWPDFMPKTAAALIKYPVRLLFQNNIQINENARFITAQIVVDNSYGLISVALGAPSSASTVTHVRVSGTLGCGASSLGVTYGDILADVDAWVLTDNGAALTPSAVAYNAIGDFYDFTVTTLTVGHTVTVKLAAPSVVDADPFFANIISEVAYSYVVA